MLEHQYIRSLLVITDFLSFIFAFVVASDTWRNHAPQFFTLGTFHLFSWLQTIFILLYVKARLQKARKEGYFRVGLAGNDDFVVNDVPGSWKVGAKVAIFIFIVDTILGLAFLAMLPVAFLSSQVQLSGVTCMGSIVSSLIHLFFCLNYILHEANGNGFWKYKVKLVIVPRDQYRKPAPGGGVKEQQPQHGAPTQEAGNSSSAPYRGSPSTRATRGTMSPREGPIRLIEPTEEDALIVEHD